MDKKKILDLAEQANLTAHAPEGLGGDGYIDNEKEILEFARLLLGTDDLVTMKTYMRDLALNLEGVMVDVEEGFGFDDGCKRTVTKVKAALYRYPQIDPNLISRPMVVKEDEK